MMAEAVKIRHIIVFCVLLTSIGASEAAKILGCPLTVIKNSALRNDEKILTMLAEHGHEVYILADSGYKPPDFVVKAGIKVIAYPRPDEISTSSDHTFNLRDMTDHQFSTAMATANIPIKACDAFTRAMDVHDRLKKGKFDLIYYNVVITCKAAIQGILGDVPSVEFLPFDIFRRIEVREMPYIPSYMPMNLHHVGHEMTFIERVLNVMMFSLMYVGWNKVHYDNNQLARQYNIEPKQPESLAFVFGGFPLEYPAPYLPDVIYLNGILAAQPKPLDAEIEQFVQSSGDHGVIIMSFGSMIKEYDEYYGNLFAEAFSKMPQKVLWKYEGPTPKTLGKNTKLVKWFPQTGLLAHNKTRLFVTHCGQNSMYETVMFGIPVLAIPLNGDQPQNAARLTMSHKMGVQLDIKTMTTDSLVTAMNDAISNPMYKENAVRLSSYLNDQPISGKELLLYWVDYAIRHGVSHLKPYGRFLPWYQFYSIDVAMFLLSVILVIVFILSKCCMCVCRRCCRSRVKSKAE